MHGYESLSTMSNLTERISSTARFFDSTLTFDFREASLPCRTFYYDKTLFIINAIVLELLKLYGSICAFEHVGTAKGKRSICAYVMFAVSYFDLFF